MDDLSALADHLALAGHATTRAMLLRDGFDDGLIRRATRAGLLLPVRRGAYITATDLPGLRTEERAARTAVAVARTSDGETVLSHLSALAVHGLPIVGARDERIHTVQLDADHLNRRGTLSHHVTPDPAAVTALPAPWSDVRVVTPGVAIAQVAMRVGFTPAIVAADAALHRRLTTPAELAGGIDLTRLVRHRHTAEGVVHLADGRAESPGETRTRMLLLRLGVHPIELQVEIRDERGFIGRVDFRIGRRGLLEFDGFVKYDGADGRVLWAEKQREDRLRRCGYAFGRVIWDDLGSVARFTRVLRASGLLDLTG